MIAKLFSRRAKIVPSAGHIPDGRRIYAIGDIHGRFDLLEGLLQRIAEDEADRGGPRGELIFLGDLVDRGPDSAKVVERLIALRQERSDTRFLLGNHEEVFLSALEGSVKGMRFFHRIGGMETILSYGITPKDYAAADFEELSQMLQAAVPDSHRQFLASFEDMIVEGDYVFVHAGIRPDVALADQVPRDLRWIREDFLRHDGAFERIVVHGHTISSDVVQLPHRIGLDTGAYHSGKLSAIGLEGGESWIVQEQG